MGDDISVGGDISGQGVAIGRGASATVSGSSNVVNGKDLEKELIELAAMVRAKTDEEDADAEAALIETAAAKAGSGDEKGAKALLKKCAGWVTDLALASGPILVKTLVKSLGI